MKYALELQEIFVYKNNNNDYIKVLNDYEQETILIVNYTKGKCEMLTDIKNMFDDMLDYVANDIYNIWDMYEDTISFTIESINNLIDNDYNVKNMNRLKDMILEYVENECIELNK